MFVRVIRPPHPPPVPSLCACIFVWKALGLVSAGTNNSRVAQLLRQLSEFYAREASHLFVTRIAQGLNHMGKVGAPSTVPVPAPVFRTCTINIAPASALVSPIRTRTSTCTRTRSVHFLYLCKYLYNIRPYKYSHLKWIQYLYPYPIHTRTRACTRTRTSTCIRTHTYTFTRSGTHTCTRTRPCTCTRTHVDTRNPSVPVPVILAAPSRLPLCRTPSRRLHDPMSILLVFPTASLSCLARRS